MKKANYALFQSQSWMPLLGRLTWAMVFAWCCLGIQEVHAQDIVTGFDPTDNTCVAATPLIDCDSDGVVDTGDRKFTDDNTTDGLYADSRMRSDTIEICPKDQWHRVKVEFTGEFDLEDGDDLLEVYDGNKDSLRVRLTSPNPIIGLGTGTGVGIHNAFGGWVNASCNPYDNPSGCLTFVFSTDGDNNKGTGWEAWVDCEERSYEFTDVNIDDIVLDCDDFIPVVVDIPTPRLTTTSCDELLRFPDDLVDITVKNAAGEICFTHNGFSRTHPVLERRATNFAAGPGTYIVEYAPHWDSHPSKVKQIQFTIKTPALVFNDTVNVNFGGACEIMVTPDMVLEDDPCTDNPDVDLGIVIKIGDLEISGTPANPPTFNRDSLAKAGADLCSGFAIVEITRTYDADPNACYNDHVVVGSTVLRYGDDTDPIFINHTPSITDTLIACGFDGDISDLVSQPRALDNCDSVVVTSTADFAGDLAPFCEGSRKVVVTHTATDLCGHTATTTDTILVMRPFEWTTAGIDTLECSDEDPGYLVSGAPRLRTGKWENNAAVYTGTMVVDTADYTCGYILSYEETIIEDNDCGRKVYRDWSSIDWCDAGAGVSDRGRQFIHYFDQTAPEFTYTGADTDEASATVFELDEDECTKVLSLTAPTAMDACDSNPTVAMYEVAQKVNGVYSAIGANLSETGALGCDTFRISWRVSDDCHTQLVEDSISRYFIINDTEDPVLVCFDKFIVSVSTVAGVVIEGSSLYQSSRDNCEVVSTLIRREGDTDWSSSILVTCEDVDHNSFNVEIQALDKTGREANCWVEIVPEDKIAPICYDLVDIDTICSDFHNGELGPQTDADEDGAMEDSEWVFLNPLDPTLDALRQSYDDLFGEPNCVDNLVQPGQGCGTLRIDQWYQLVEESCGALTIRRRFNATDWGSSNGGANTSGFKYQTINVAYDQNWTLNFPADARLTCNDGTIPAPDSYDDIVSSGSCDNFLLNVEADTFHTPGDVCMKIIRTYELINWCVYDPDQPAVVIPNDPDGNATISSATASGDGKFVYSQVIKIDVSDGGISINHEPVELCIYSVGDVSPFGEEDSPTNPAYECDTLRVFRANGANCLGLELASFEYSVSVAGAVIAEGVGDSVEVNVEPGVTYDVTFTGYDGCGNSNSKTLPYTFSDCFRPYAIAIQGIAVDLDANGEIFVWASDVDKYSFDNCTDQDDLDLRIGIGDATAGAKTLEEVLALGTSVKLTCINVGDQFVTLYVVDESGNWSAVTTTIDVQANIPGSCDGVVSGNNLVAGHIVNVNGENVEQVAVEIQVAGTMQEAMTTGTDGEFQFSLAAGEDYTVTPLKDMFPLNGVTTLDLVLMSKHILGITSFTSPYEFIAADVNKSGAITAYDMVQVRQLILQLIPSFPDNDSWRFVDAKHDFGASTDSPLAQNFGEFMDINLTENMMNVDFIGVKVGDVSGNALANSLLGAESRSTNGTLTFNTADRFVEAGETVAVEFTSADIAAAQGYQFTMNFTGLNFNKLEEGLATAGNFNTNLAKKGVIATSWEGTATATDVLFTLNFEATTSGLLSDLISVSSDITEAEGYNNDGELLDINIEFATSEVSADFELGQNTPNPFNGNTVIGFTLPQAGTATLRVMDMQGKILKSIKSDYARGYNTVSLKANELGATGVLYYQLESADNVATRKMIVIE